MSSPPSLESFDWSDLNPISLPDIKNELAPIMYSKEYEHSTSLLRACMAKMEYSERAVAATAAVLAINPAHYTAWEYRYQSLKRIGSSWIPKEDAMLQDVNSSFVEHGEWINGMTLNHSKNYQIWNYRRLLLNKESHDYFEGERLIIKLILEDDEKNFHVWSHYKWLLKEVPNKDLDDQLKKAFKLCDRLIERDVRNNSAWSFRYFLWKIDSDRKLGTSAGFDEEVNFVQSQIALVPQNEASWNYLIGIFEEYKSNDELQSLMTFCESFQNVSLRALELLADIYKTAGKIEQCSEIYQLLIKKVPIRRGYWEYKKNLLTV